MDFSKIKALTWDIGGTVFDMDGGIRDEVGRLTRQQGAQVDAGKFVGDWFKATREVKERIRKGQLPQVSGEEIRRRSLEEVSNRFKLTKSGQERLSSVWHRLKAFPGASDAISRLRTRYTVVALTIMSFGSAVDCSKANGITWDGILSCEFLGYEKPELETYRQGVKLLGLKPEQVMMVASHKWDLLAAREAGLQTAYISDPEGLGKGVGQGVFPDPSFAINAVSFGELARQLLG